MQSLHSHMRPYSFDVMISETPPTSVLTKGMPQARASNITVGFPSFKLGSTNISQAFIHRGSSSLGFLPTSLMTSSRPHFFISFCSSFLRFPSPKIIHKMSFDLPSSSLMAWMRSMCPLTFTRLPMVRIILFFFFFLNI